jgi:hypothetical protein
MVIENLLEHPVLLEKEQGTLPLLLRLQYRNSKIKPTISRESEPTSRALALHLLLNDLPSLTLLL